MLPTVLVPRPEVCLPVGRASSQIRRHTGTGPITALSLSERIKSQASSSVPQRHSRAPQSAQAEPAPYSRRSRADTEPFKALQVATRHLGERHLEGSPTYENRCSTTYR